MERFFKLTQWGIFLMAAHEEDEKEDALVLDIFSQMGERENDETQSKIAPGAPS